jgi:hypothetical protein
VNATRPTSKWRNGQIITDRIAIPVQTDTLPGTYHLQVGLYNLSTMERLAVLDSTGERMADRVILETIQVTTDAVDEKTVANED